MKELRILEIRKEDVKNKGMIILLSIYTVVFLLIILLFRMSFLKSVAIIASFHVVVFLILFNLRVSIAEGRYFNFLRWFVQNVIPPDDLYKNILHEEIRVDETKNRYSFKFRIKYDGKQSVGLLLNNFTLFRKNSRKLEKTPLVIRVKMYDDDNNVYFSGLLSNWVNQFDGQYGSGIVMKNFWSPREVPSRRDIQCDVEVVTADKQLQEYYAPIKLFIGKESEK